LLLVDLPARLDPGLASKRKLVDEFIFTPLAGIPGIFLVTTGWWLSQKLRCWADHWDFPCLTCDQTEALLAKIRPGQPLTDGSTAEEVFRASQGIASTVAVIARRGEVSAGLETIISAQLGDRWNSPPWRAVLDRLACLDHGLNDLSNPFQELEALLNNPVTGETLLPPGLLESLGEVRGACPLGRVIESLRKRGLLFWRGDDGWTFGHLGHLLQYQFQRRYPEHWEQLKLQAYDVFSQYEAKFQKSVWVSTIQHYRQQLLDAGISIPGEG
jgi:hypothetical protein